MYLKVVLSIYLSLFLWVSAHESLKKTNCIFIALCQHWLIRNSARLSLISSNICFYLLFRLTTLILSDIYACRPLFEVETSICNAISKKKAKSLSNNITERAQKKTNHRKLTVSESLCLSVYVGNCVDRLSANIPNEHILITLLCDKL